MKTTSFMGTLISNLPKTATAKDTTNFNNADNTERKLALGLEEAFKALADNLPDEDTIELSFERVNQGTKYTPSYFTDTKAPETVITANYDYTSKNGDKANGSDCTKLIDDKIVFTEANNVIEHLVNDFNETLKSFNQ